MAVTVSQSATPSQIAPRLFQVLQHWYQPACTCVCCRYRHSMCCSGAHHNPCAAGVDASSSNSTLKRNCSTVGAHLLPQHACHVPRLYVAPDSPMLCMHVDVFAVLLQVHLVVRTGIVVCGNNHRQVEQVSLWQPLAIHRLWTGSQPRLPVRRGGGCPAGSRARKQAWGGRTGGGWGLPCNAGAQASMCGLVQAGTGGCCAVA